MLSDIVIDTNVFAHASNPENGRFIESSEFLDRLMQVSTDVVVDESYSPLEAQNTSAIFSEYLEHLTGFDLASSVIANLVATGRIKDLPRTVNQKCRDYVNQNVPDASDRKFLYIAINSNEKILVSNDEADFNRRCRRTSARKIGVRILFSPDATVLL